MAFPFVAPFEPWVREIMLERERNRVLSMFKNPYVIMSSGALVMKHGPQITAQEKAQVLQNILKNPQANIRQGDKVYRGCVIANNVTQTDLSYNLSETIIGYDFDGKPILVEGERGRLVSTPIIESLEIDTDGANNTTKTARVNIKCFTLKQLELFEMFFMKPSMNVLIEFGDATILGKQSKVTLDRKNLNVYRNGAPQQITTANTINECLIDKSSFDAFRDSFGKYYRSDIKGTIEYFSNIEKSLGSWDMIAGKVINYNYTYSDGAYNVMIEVSQPNQISIALPCSARKKTSQETVSNKDKEGVEYLAPDQILDTIAYNLDLDKTLLKELISRTPHPEKDTSGDAGVTEWISKETFNFIKIDADQSDAHVSQIPYISLRFILHILMNYVLTGDMKSLAPVGNSTVEPSGSILSGGNDKTFRFTVPSGIVKGKKVEIIPIRIVDNLMSSTEPVLYPNDNLPKMTVVTTKNKKPQGEDNKIVMSADSIKGKINGYDIRVMSDTIPNVYYQEGGIDKEGNGPLLKIPDEEIEIELDDKTKTKGKLVLGNALNMFINFNQVVNSWKKEIYRVDFLENLLKTINQNSYGLFQLVYAPIYENGPATVIDFKFCQAITDSHLPKPSDIQVNDYYYRFNMTPSGSNVLDFNFSFEMGNLVAGQTIFNQNKLVNQILDATAESGSTGELVIPESVYKAVDKSTMANSDGWYSINFIEYESAVKKAEKEQARLNKGGTPQKEVTPPEEKQDAEKPDKQGLEDFIHDKSLRFITDPKKYVPPPKPKPPVVVVTVGGDAGPKVGAYDPKTRKPLPAGVPPEVHNKILELAAGADSEIERNDDTQLYSPNAAEVVRYSFLTKGSQQSEIEKAAKAAKFEPAVGVLKKWYDAGGRQFLRLNAKPGTYYEELAQYEGTNYTIAKSIWNYSIPDYLGNIYEDFFAGEFSKIKSKQTWDAVELILKDAFGAPDEGGGVLVTLINNTLGSDDGEAGKKVKAYIDSALKGYATFEFDYIDEFGIDDYGEKSGRLNITGKPPAANNPTSTPSAGTAGGGAPAQPKPNYAGTTVMIYKDQPFLLDRFTSVVEKSKRTSTLSPITVSLTVQGFSGFRAGACFNITGVPEKFNDDGIFQITNIKHNISQDGWKTTLEAQWNHRPKKF